MENSLDFSNDRMLDEIRLATDVAASHNNSNSNLQSIPYNNNSKSNNNNNNYNNIQDSNNIQTPDFFLMEENLNMNSGNTINNKSNSNSNNNKNNNNNNTSNNMNFETPIRMDPTPTNTITTTTSSTTNSAPLSFEANGNDIFRNNNSGILKNYNNNDNNYLQSINSSLNASAIQSPSSTANNTNNNMIGNNNKLMNNEMFSNISALTLNDFLLTRSVSPRNGSNPNPSNSNININMASTNSTTIRANPTDSKIDALSPTSNLSGPVSDLTSIQEIPLQQQQGNNNNSNNNIINNNYQQKDQNVNSNNGNSTNNFLGSDISSGSNSFMDAPQNNNNVINYNDVSNNLDSILNDYIASDILAMDPVHVDFNNNFDNTLSQTISNTLSDDFNNNNNFNDNGYRRHSEVVMNNQIPTLNPTSRDSISHQFDMWNLKNKNIQNHYNNVAANANMNNNNNNNNNTRSSSLRNGSSGATTFLNEQRDISNVLNGYNLDFNNPFENNSTTYNNNNKMNNETSNDINIDRRKSVAGNPTSLQKQIHSRYHNQLHHHHHHQQQQQQQQQDQSQINVIQENVLKTNEEPLLLSTPQSPNNERRYSIRKASHRGSVPILDSDILARISNATTMEINNNNTDVLSRQISNSSGQGNFDSNNNGPYNVTDANEKLYNVRSASPSIPTTNIQAYNGSSFVRSTANLPDNLPKAGSFIVGGGSVVGIVDSNNPSYASLQSRKNSRSTSTIPIPNPRRASAFNASQIPLNTISNSNINNNDDNNNNNNNNNGNNAPVPLSLQNNQNAIINTAEDRDKPFRCAECFKSFKRSEHLKRHVRSVHTQERPYPCTLCRKKFSRSDNLSQHMKTHKRHGEI